VWPVGEVELLIDPAVSKAKFNRALAAYRECEDDYLRRGWWLLKADYPQVFMVFATACVKPPSIVFGALLDFTNYDLWPPSVKLVDPFTRAPYLFKDLPSALNRRLPAGPPPEFVQQLAAQGVALQAPTHPMMQAHRPDDVPFLCLPGVREYHDHPAHSGDSWFLHRGHGEGTLHFILEQIYRYGVEPLTGYRLGLEVKIVGFQSGEAPE
jgi:hypothetical protein